MEKKFDKKRVNPKSSPKTAPKGAPGKGPRSKASFKDSPRSPYSAPKKIVSSSKPVKSLNEEAEEKRPLGPARLCFIADFKAPQAYGRIFSELMSASRNCEVPFSCSMNPGYLHQKDFPLTSIVSKVVRRPDTGRIRIHGMSAFALPDSIEKGYYWAFTGFDAINSKREPLKKLKQVDKVFVPSTLHMEACVKAGVDSEKVQVFVPPVNTRSFHPRLQCPEKFKKGKNYRFIVVGGPLRKKGIDLILKAFIEEFKAEEKVELVLKLTHMPKVKKSFKYEIADLKKRVGALNEMFPKVMIIDETIDERELAGLMASGNAYVTANRAYNWALSVREAMACALPIVGPDVLKDLLGITDEQGYFFSTKKAKVGESEIYPGSKPGDVHEPNMEEFKLAMRTAFTNRNQARKKGLVGQRALKAQPGWKEASRALYKLADD